MNASRQFARFFSVRILLRFAALIVVVCSTPFCIGATIGNESEACRVVRTSESLNCAAKDMKDELKCHFKGTKGYAKMLVANARIKLRSAAVSRRIDRDPCYRGFERDVEKLNELTCELSSLYETALLCSSQGVGKPICECTAHVGDKIAAMRQLADCLTCGTVNVGVVHTAFFVKEIVPNNAVAPGVPYIASENQGLAPALEGPMISEPPALQSVLEK